MHRNRIGSHLVLVVMLSVLTLSAMFGTPERAATLYESPRTQTVSLTFVDAASYPGRATNAGIALKQLQDFFDAAPMQSGIDYSFNSDVLHNTITAAQGYVDTPDGYGYGVNAAASLLNQMIYNAAFWDTDMIEKPLMIRVHDSVLRGDRTYTVYGVNITLDVAGKNNVDFVWRLNPAYSGPVPKFTLHFDAAAGSATMTVIYANAVTPPARSLSLHDKGALLTNSLHTIIGDRQLGVTLIPVASPTDEVDVHADLQVPVASAWKGGGTVYFFENIDPAIWTSVPVKYWNLRSVARVPPEYQKAWLQNNKILRWVYVMAVFSGNHEGGDVLDYVYRHSKWHTSANAIAAFNDWSQQVVGISPASGLHRWQAGATWSASAIDHRRDNHTILVNGQTLPFDNTYSAHDLARYYLYLATVGKQRGYYDTVSELLSTHTDILSMIKSFSADSSIQAASKIGYFAPDSPDSLGHDVNNDGGLLTLPDGEQYALASMTIDAVDIQGNVVNTVSRALVNTYENAGKPSF